MAHPMEPDERRSFLSAGTRTAKLATTRADGRPHVAPVWFVLDGDDWVFMTGADTVKGKALLRDGRVALSVDDERPPFSFVLVEGTVAVSEDPQELLHWSTLIGGRYMGAERAAEFGARNAVPGELLLRLTPTRTVAMADVAD